MYGFKDQETRKMQDKFSGNYYIVLLYTSELRSFAKIYPDWQSY